MKDSAIMMNILSFERLVLPCGDLVLIDEARLKATISRLIVSIMSKMKAEEFKELTLHQQIDQLFIEAAKVGDNKANEKLSGKD